MYFEKCDNSLALIHLLSSMDLFLNLIRYCVTLLLLRCRIRLSSIHSSFTREFVSIVIMLSFCVVSVTGVSRDVFALDFNSSRITSQSYVLYAGSFIIVFDLYGRKYWMWTTSCKYISLWFKSSLYETSPIRLIILNGPIYTSRTFLQCLNCGKCFVDNNTSSPTLNLTSRRFLSA